MGISQIVSFLHVVCKPEFVNLSFLKITYIISTHQVFDEILEVSTKSQKQNTLENKKTKSNSNKYKKQNRCQN